MKTKKILFLIAASACMLAMTGCSFMKGGPYTIDPTVPAEQCATVYVCSMFPRNIDGKDVIPSKLQNTIGTTDIGMLLFGIKIHKLTVPAGNHVLNLYTDDNTYATLGTDFKAGEKYIITKIDKSALEKLATEIIGGTNTYAILPYTEEMAEKYGVTKFWGNE